MNLLNEIWKFSLNPQLSPFDKPSLSFGGFFKILLIFYGVAFISVIPSVIVAKIIDKIYSINLIELRDQNIKNLYHGFYLIVVMVFLGPLLEEIIFRLWLSLKKSHIIITLIAIIWISITKYEGIIIYNQILDYQFFKHLLLSIIFGFLVFYLFQFIPIKKINPNYFKILYWISCTSFGLIHIFNFHPLKLSIIWIYPFLVTVQLVMAYFVGYLRLRKGFFVGLAFHCLINLPSALIYYFHQK